MHLSIRGAVAVALVGVLGVSGALVATTAAQAVPDAPVIFGPLDSTINVLTANVDPAPSAVEQTVTVSWELQETGAVGVGCQVVIPADTLDGTTFPCDVIVPDGQYGFYDLVAVSTDVDGDSIPSNTISSVRYGAAATPSSLELGPPLNVPDVPIRIGTLEPAISGTAPALGTVEMLGYRSDLGVGTESSLCFVGVPTSGAFSCPATFPSYGIWEVRVIAQDVEGGFAVEPEAVESTLRLEVFPPTPTTAISTSFSAIDIDLNGLPGSNVGASVVLDAFVAPTSGGFCPVAWDGNPAAPPAEGPSVNCVVSDVAPGIHLVRSTQFLNGAVSNIRDDVIYVAAAPTLVVAPVPGGAVFSGTVDTLDSDLTASGTQIDGLTAVVRNGATDTVCSGPVDLATGTWSCDGEVGTGDDSFTAYTVVQGFGDDPAVSGVVNGSYGTGASLSVAVDATIPAGVTPPAPTMTYGLGPASIDVTAQGLENSAVGVRLYEVEVISGEGYQYGEAVASCGAVIEGEGEGSGSIVTAPSLIDDCLFSNLAPGIWNVYSSQNYYFQESEYRDHYVLIPPTPTLAATRASTGQVTASGAGEPGYRVQVRQLGGGGQCTTVVDTGGDWSCVVSGTSGDMLLRAQQQSQGFEATPPVYFGLIESFDGYSAFTPTVFVASAPAQAVNPPLTVLQPLPWVLEGYDGSPLTPGQQLSLSASGLPVGTTIVIEIRSTPQVLGTTVVDDTGSFAIDVVVPDDLAPGQHTLVAIATPPGGVESPVEIPVTVLELTEPIDAAPPAEELETMGETDDGASGSGGSGGAGDRSRLDTPSAITDSIPTIERIFAAPLTIIVSGGLALALLLLVAFPAELLNSTLASNTRRLGRWYAAIESGVGRATEWFASVTRTRALAAAVLVVITSLIFGFVDPEYGLDPVSVRMTVSLAIGLFIVTYVAAWISGAIIKRVWSIETRVSLQPAALVFAVLGVIVARILEFSPGFLIGLVIGLDLVTRVGAPHRVRAILTNIGVIVGLAVVSWVGFSVMAALMTGEPTTVGLLISDALVATTSEGLTAALATLLPLGYLSGHEVFRRSKLLWAGSFAAVATLFSLIVLPTAEGETGDVADVGFWMLVMVIFAAVTLTLWALLHFTGRGEGDDDELVEQPAAAAAR